MVTPHTLIPWWGCLTLYWITPLCGLSSPWLGSDIHAEPWHIGHPPPLICLWPPVLPTCHRALMLCVLDCSCTWPPPHPIWALTAWCSCLHAWAPSYPTWTSARCSGSFSSLPFPTASVEAHLGLPYPMALGMNCSGKKRERQGCRGKESFLLKFGPEKCVQHNCFFKG